MSKVNQKFMLRLREHGVNKTYGANGVLSRLFRQMLLNLNVGDGSRFGALLQAYILDARHGVPNNKKDQQSMRGNLTKELSRPQMTWKVFCKALRFLQIVKIELSIKAYHEDGRTSLHQTTVDLGRRRDMHEFNEALEQPEEQEAVQTVTCLEPYEAGYKNETPN